MDWPRVCDEVGWTDPTRVPRHLPASRYLVMMTFSSYAAARKAMGANIGLIVSDAPQVVSKGDPLAEDDAINILRRVLGSLEALDPTETVLQRWGR